MQIAIAEAKAHLAKLIRRAEAGEEIELTRYGRAVARIVGPKPAQVTGLVGCMKGQFQAPEDLGAGDAEVEKMFSAGEPRRGEAAAGCEKNRLNPGQRSTPHGDEQPHLVAGEGADSRRDRYRQARGEGSGGACASSGGAGRQKAKLALSE